MTKLTAEKLLEEYLNPLENPELTRLNLLRWQEWGGQLVSPDIKDNYAAAYEADLRSCIARGGDA